jgi:hypothetical protein
LEQVQQEESAKRATEAAKRIIKTRKKAVRGCTKWPGLAVYPNIDFHVKQKEQSLINQFQLQFARHIQRTPDRICFHLVRDGYRLTDLLEALFLLGAPFPSLIEQLYVDGMSQSVALTTNDQENIVFSVTSERGPSPVPQIQRNYEVLASIFPLHIREMFGEPLFDKLSNDYMTHVLLVHIPTTPGDLESFHAVQQGFNEIKSTMIQLNLIRENYQEKSNFLLREQYFKKKAGIELNQVRRILLDKRIEEVHPVPLAPGKDWYDAMLSSFESSSDPPMVFQSQHGLLTHPHVLTFPTSCLISTKINQLIQIIENLIFELEALPKEFHPGQIDLIHQVIQFYIFLTSGQFSQIVPRVALLSFNDDMYLVHWLTKFCLVCDHGASFQETILKLTQKGKDTFHGQLVTQKGILFETLRPLEGWLDDVDKNKPQIERCFLQIGDLLKQLSRVLKVLGLSFC